MHAFHGLLPPVGKHLDILRAVLEPSDDVKQIDLCCGLGFGKTSLAIQAAALTLNEDHRSKGLFLEPDWDRVDQVFVPAFEEAVPSELYTRHRGQAVIEWHNGAVLLYRPRVITGSRERSRDKNRGIEFSFVIDDEAAVGFDIQQFQNTFARIRRDAENRYYFTASTPKIGPYGTFLSRGGNTMFRGRSDENHYLLERDPDYVTRLRAIMSHDQALRELDGELIALEGRIWTDWSEEMYPAGNIFPGREFDYDQPFILSVDLGMKSAWGIWQRVTGVGQNTPLMCLVAEWQPDDGDARKMVREINKEYGRPGYVIVGHDVNTRSYGDSSKPAFFFNAKWPGVRLNAMTMSELDPEIGYNVMQGAICNDFDQRQMVVAEHCKFHTPDSGRTIHDLMRQDCWPENSNQFFDKDKGRNKSSPLEDERDMLRYLAYKTWPPSARRERRVA